MNTFDGLINRVDTAKEKVNEPEDRSIETSQTEKHVLLNKRSKKTEWNSRELWDHFRRCNIYAIISEEKKNGAGKRL